MKRGSGFASMISHFNHVRTAVERAVANRGITSGLPARLPTKAVPIIQGQNHLGDLCDIPCIVNSAVWLAIKRQAMLLQSLAEANP